MNASRLQQFSCVLTDRMAASLYPGLLAARTAAAAPMKSADLHLIPSAVSQLLEQFRFSRSRSYLACHHTRLLRNLRRSPCANIDLDVPCRRLRRFHAHVVLSVRTTMGEYRPDHSRHLVRQCNDHDIRWSTLLHLLNPLAGFLRMRQYRSSTVNQQRTQIRVATLRYPVQVHFASGACLLGYKTSPGCEFTSGSEDLRIAHHCNRRRRR